MKKLVVFDLDGTLADSKSSIDTEMARLFDSLLMVVQIAVISGGAWPQFQKQLLAPLSSGECMKSLSLLPTCGTQFYRYASVLREIHPGRKSEDHRVVGGCNCVSWL